MADIETTISSETPAATVPAAKSPKVKKAKSAASAGGVKKPKSKPNHPPTSEMVQSAIKALKERGGSSLQAIKKYISATYKIDADKLSPFIKKYLKGAVISGQLVQTKGKGASGSFKISAALKPKSPKKSVGDKPTKSGGGGGGAAAKKTAPKKAVAGSDKKPKSVAKKVAASGAKKIAAKKPGNDKKKAAAATAKSVKKSGSVKSAPKQKPTKPKADAVKKPKTPKPKKAAPKKAAAKK